jgi:hypothetical protein
MTLSDNPTDFWIACAAAAPVIALAGLVAITDTAVTGNIIKRARMRYPALRDEMMGGGREFLGPPSAWIFVYSMFNLLAQGFVLIVALLALLQNGTPIPGISIIVVEGVGLLFLLVAAWLAGQVGAESQRWEERLGEIQRATRAEELAQAIASKFGKLTRSPQETVAATTPEKKPDEAATHE